MSGLASWGRYLPQSVPISESGGTRRPKNFQKSAAPVKRASRSKSVWRNETTTTAATMPSVSRLLSLPTSGGRGTATAVVASGATQVLLAVDGPAVDLLE